MGGDKSGFANFFALLTESFCRLTRMMPIVLESLGAAKFKHLDAWWCAVLSQAWPARRSAIWNVRTRWSRAQPLDPSEIIARTRVSMTGVIGPQRYEALGCRC